MDSESFIQWALDPVRTNEEKYTVELIVEVGVQLWHFRHQTGFREDPDTIEERKRQRKLNPAYVASYSEADLRKASEVLGDQKHWAYIPYSDRPIQDLKAFQFLDLESLDLTSCEASDLSPVARIPNLRSFTFSSAECLDFRPLGECAKLRYLNLTFSVPWPEVAGLERLQDLEELHLTGNLLAFAPGTSWSKVRRGRLLCTPLAARSCKEIPVLPECLFLTLGGVDRLDGIEQMSRLRNLVLQGVVQDYAPLIALKELTCLTIEGDKPREVNSLAQLPKLQFAQFGDPFLANTPRDYSPLAEAPMLRELIVLGCPPVDMEVEAINAGLGQWDDLFLAPTPWEVPPLRMLISGQEPLFPLTVPEPDPEEDGFVDLGMRSCEGRWVAEFLQQGIQQRIGIPHWGIASANGENRTFYLEIHAIEAIEIFPDFLQAVRGCLAELRHHYSGTLTISLQNPRTRFTSAEIDREEHLRERQEDAEFDQWQRDQEEYLDRLHRYELKKQEGGPIDPAEFSVPEQEVWDEEEPEEEEADFLVEDEETEEEEEQNGAFLFEEEHPLAEHYRLTAFLSLEVIRFHPEQREIAIHLMRREPDL